MPAPTTLSTGLSTATATHGFFPACQPPGRAAVVAPAKIAGVRAGNGVCRLPTATAACRDLNPKGCVIQRLSVGLVSVQATQSVEEGNCGLRPPPSLRALRR